MTGYNPNYDWQSDEGALMRLAFQEVGGLSLYTPADVDKGIRAILATVFNRVAFLNSPDMTRGRTAGWGNVGASIKDVIYSNGENPRRGSPMTVQYQGFTKGGIASIYTDRFEAALNGSGRDCDQLQLVVHQVKLALAGGLVDPFGPGVSWAVFSKGQGTPGGTGLYELGTIAGQTFYGWREFERPTR